MPKSAKEVVITVSWPKLITGCGSLAAIAAASLWAVGNFWLTDIKADIREVRADFKTAMAENTTVRGIIAGTDKELSQKISETREIVGRIDIRVDSMASDMKDVRADVREMKSVVLKLPQSK